MRAILRAGREILQRIQNTREFIDASRFLYFREKLLQSERINALSINGCKITIAQHELI